MNFRGRKLLSQTKSPSRSLSTSGGKQRKAPSSIVRGRSQSVILSSALLRTTSPPPAKATTSRPRPSSRPNSPQGKRVMKTPKKARSKSARKASTSSYEAHLEEANATILPQISQSPIKKKPLKRIRRSRKGSVPKSATDLGATSNKN